MLLLEHDGRDCAPCFSDRDAATAFNARLGPGPDGPYVVQAMHLYDLAKLAAGEGFGLLCLDGEGRVLDKRSIETCSAPSSANSLESEDPEGTPS
jgi:hypothetical protein